MSLTEASSPVGPVLGCRMDRREPRIPLSGFPVIPVDRSLDQGRARSIPGRRDRSPIARQREAGSQGPGSGGPWRGGPRIGERRGGGAGSGWASGGVRGRPAVRRRLRHGQDARRGGGSRLPPEDPSAPEDEPGARVGRPGAAAGLCVRALGKRSAKAVCESALRGPRRRRAVPNLVAPRAHPAGGPPADPAEGLRPPPRASRRSPRSTLTRAPRTARVPAPIVAV